jgi:perosamine synthetase
VFCLYKTLPVPNGAILTQNTTRLEALARLPLRDAGSMSVMGRTAELMVQRLRSRADRIGAALERFKRRIGRAAGAMELERIRVGDIGFDLADVDLRMSAITERLLTRLDFSDIQRRRIANYKTLAEALRGSARLLHDEIPDGVCPLFLPIVVEDKRAAADTLRANGVEVLEFWNHGLARFDAHSSASARFLRAHVLGMPIHQDLTPHHLAHIAEVVCHLQLGSA